MGGPLGRLLGEGAIRLLHIYDGSRTLSLSSLSDFDFGCATVKSGPINALPEKRVQLTRESI